MDPLEGVRSKRETTEKKLEIMERRLEPERCRSVLRAAVVHAARLDEAEELRGKVLSCLQCGEFCLSELTPAPVARAGPGTLGVGWYMH